MARDTHTCSRCGQQDPYRTSGAWDELVEWVHHSHEIEHHYRVRLHRVEAQLAAARERVDQLRALVNALPDPVPDIAIVEEEEGLPF